jgi:hypothetical protein
LNTSSLLAVVLVDTQPLLAVAAVVQVVIEQPVNSPLRRGYLLLLRLVLVRLVAVTRPLAVVLTLLLAQLLQLVAVEAVQKIL